MNNVYVLAVRYGKLYSGECGEGLEWRLDEESQTWEKIKGGKL